MCIILPVSHIACTHTIAIWQHCIDATRYGQDGIKPCWNVKQHEQAVLTRRPCEDCSGQRYFARRGGVADRGNGSPITPPSEVDTKTNGEDDDDDDDDADDSGYHSDVIHEEDEASDRDERPLSPKALAPQQPRTRPCRMRKQSHRSLTRKPSWKPNLKRDLSLEYEPSFQPRRDSIDSLISKFGARDMRIAHMETRQSTEDLSRSPTPARSSRRMRESTLLHPSSPPPLETTGHAQMAKAFPFPQIVDVKNSSRPVLRARKNSTLLHPSSPTLDPARPGPLRRRESSLLHPSKPSDAEDMLQHRTILSIPPRHTQSQHAIPSRRMPLLQTARSDPQSATMARQREASIMHADSDAEEEIPTATAPSSSIPGFACFNFSFGKRTANHPGTGRNRSASSSSSSSSSSDEDSVNEFWNGVWEGGNLEDNQDDVEEGMLRDSARVARESRGGGSARVVREVVWTKIEGGVSRKQTKEKKFWKC